MPEVQVSPHIHHIEVDPSGKTGKCKCGRVEAYDYSSGYLKNAQVKVIQEGNPNYVDVPVTKLTQNVTKKSVNDTPDPFKNIKENHPGSWWHKFYKDHQQEILEDVEKHGLQETAKLWHIHSVSTLKRNIEEWSKKEKPSRRTRKPALPSHDNTQPKIKVSPATFQDGKMVIIIHIHLPSKMYSS